MKNKLITAYEYLGMALMYSTIYLPITIVLAVSLSLSFISLGLKRLSRAVMMLGQITSRALEGYWRPLELHRKTVQRLRGVHIPDFVNERPHDPCACGSGRKFKNCHGAKRGR